MWTQRGGATFYPRAIILTIFVEVQKVIHTKYHQALGLTECDKKIFLYIYVKHVTLGVEPFFTLGQ